MVAVDVLPKLLKLTVEQAERWVAAALAEARALREHDAQLFPVSYSDPGAMRMAEDVHAAWRRWADAAESLFEQVRPLRAGGRHVEGADDLEYAIGRAQAMLQITPASHAKAKEQIQRGEVVPVEEIRRELRNRLRAGRPGSV